MLARYPNAQDIVWCQEEPQNQGAWFQIRHRLQELAERLPVYYAGRAPGAAPATGLAKTHESEQRQLVETALSAAPAAQGARSPTRAAAATVAATTSKRKSS